jgi:hypothetical protein
MWRSVGWLLPARLVCLEPVIVPAKSNFVLLLAAKPNTMPGPRLIFSSPGLAAKPKKKKDKDKDGEEEKATHSRKPSFTSKFIKVNKKITVDVWDSMSLSDLGK